MGIDEHCRLAQGSLGGDAQDNVGQVVVCICDGGPHENQVEAPRHLLDINLHASKHALTSPDRALSVIAVILTLDELPGL